YNGRKNAGRREAGQRRIRVVGWDRYIRLEIDLSGRGLGSAQNPQRRCESCFYECSCVSTHRCSLHGSDAWAVLISFNHWPAEPSTLVAGNRKLTPRRSAGLGRTSEIS